MKRLIGTIIMAAMLLVSSLLIIPVGAEEPTLTTDKTQYTVTDPIYVSASSDNSSGKDWVGIAPKDFYTSGTIAWNYLKDVGENYDITKASNRGTDESLAPYRNFPAGEYIIYLIPEDMTLTNAVDGNKVLASTEIKIVDDPNASLKSPVAATYDLKDAASGMADGTLKITLPENHYADDIYMWWANDEGILEDYTRLARFKVPSRETTEFTHEMTPNTLIPAEATGLLIYTYSNAFGMSEEYVEVKLPEGAGYDFPAEEPLTEFQSVSDIHIGSNLATENFKRALEDIVANSPNSSGIFANGDLIDVGSNVQLWTELWNTYDSVENAPAFFPGIGNHEYYTDMSYADGLNSFIENIRMPEGYEKPNGVPYYDVWVNGYHYIFLGDAVTSGCDIGDIQYNWFEERLAEKTDDRPVFVFFHQPMKNTVAGSMESEGWWDLDDDERMRQILEDHPEIIFFNGHTHWVLDSYNTMYGGGNEAAIFNTASISYLWHSYYVAGGEYQKGSEGFYVKVYKDRVLLLGRDFENGKWVSSAQFVLDSRYADVESADETTEPTAADQPLQEESGYVSTLAAIGAALVCLLGAAAIFIKKIRR